MNIKKVSSIILSATTTIWLSGAAAFMPIASAQTVAELQAQIAALLASINTLQSQLTSLQGGGASSSYNYTRDLTIGSKGDDVSALQNWLAAQAGAQWPAGQAATGYFGSITKAALANYQASAGISPAAGYFGPKSRAHVASIGGPAPVSTTPSTTPVVTAPASGVAASLASDSPTGSAISGAGQISVAKYGLTAAATAGATVTDLSFTKVGVVSDTAVNNMYLADETGVIIAQYQSLNQGVAVFSGLNISVNAGQTRYISLRMDLSTGANAGNTISWKLSGVTAGGAAISGLPVQSHTLTVTTVSNPSIASATLTFNTVGNTVNAGTTGVIVANVTANVSNSAVNLKNIRFTVVGSANMADLRNLKLMVNGAQVGSILSTVASNGAAVFDLGDAPAKLGTGNSVIELFADVLGSPNRTAQFTILRPYDAHLIDSQYNVGISPTVTTTNATSITINQGQITVSLASNTPTGNVPIGASNVTLGKFTVYASGEPVKIKFLDVRIARTGAADWSVLASTTLSVSNIKVIDDAGNQIGSTINDVTSGTTNGTCTLVTANITCHFGTSSSNINYSVPANTTRVLSVVTDVKSTLAGVTGLQAVLPGNTSNLEGQISFQSANSGSANGATLTISTTPLTIGLNTAFAAPTYVAGAIGVRIASFVLTASSAEGVKVSSLTFDKDSGTDALDIQNVKVMVGTTQFGSTRNTVADGGVTMAFSGTTSITVPAGGSVTVDIYADILSSSTGSGATAIDYTSWTALGSVSNSSITAASAVDGQSVTLSSGPILTLAQDSATPASKQLVMGLPAQELFKMRMTNDNVEDVKVTDITFRDNITSGSAGIASFQNMTVWDGALQVAGPLNMTMPGATTGTVAFSFTTPITVAKNTSKTVTLKGDTATFVSGGATSNSQHNFAISATSSVTAIGGSSNTSAIVSGTPNSNTSTIVRSKLTFNSSLLGAGSSRPRIAIDDIATINWIADAANQVTVNTVSIKFVGLAVSNGTTITADLIDTNTNANWGSSVQGTCNAGAGNSCSINFSPTFIISANTTKAVKVRTNSSAFFGSGVTGTESLSALINAAGDVTWNDGNNNFSLEATIVPATLVNVSYE